MVQRRHILFVAGLPWRRNRRSTCSRYSLVFSSHAVSQPTLNQIIHPNLTLKVAMVIFSSLSLLTAYISYLVLSAVSRPPRDATVLLNPPDVCCRLQRVLFLSATGISYIVCINTQGSSFARCLTGTLAYLSSKNACLERSCNFTRNTAGQ